MGNAVGAEAHAVDAAVHAEGADFDAAADAESVVGDVVYVVYVVYVATAGWVVYGAASCGSAGGELDRCPS